MVKWHAKYVSPKEFSDALKSLMKAANVEYICSHNATFEIDGKLYNLQSGTKIKE